MNLRHGLIPETRFLNMLPTLSLFWLTENSKRWPLPVMKALYFETQPVGEQPTAAVSTCAKYTRAVLKIHGQERNVSNDTSALTGIKDFVV